MKMIGQSLQAKKEMTIIVMFILIINLSLVTAFGVSAPYWGDNPLYLEAGQSKETAVYIQNLASGDEDLLVTVKLKSGSEIATINEQEVYDVPFGTDNLAIPIFIHVPETAKSGDKWTISLSFATSANQEETGTIQFNTGVEKSFDVIVMTLEERNTPPPQAPEEESKNTTLIIGTIVLTIIIAMIIILLLFHKKSEQTNVKKRKK